MQHTDNLNLNKPDGVDQFNVEHFNENADIIDTSVTNLINRLDELGITKEQYDGNSESANKLTLLDIDVTPETDTPTFWKDKGFGIYKYNLNLSSYPNQGLMSAGILLNNIVNSREENAVVQIAMSCSTGMNNISFRFGDLDDNTWGDWQKYVTYDWWDEKNTMIWKELALKVDKITGKQLSTNDFTNNFKTTLIDLDLTTKGCVTNNTVFSFRFEKAKPEYYGFLEFNFVYNSMPCTICIIIDSSVKYIVTKGYDIVDSITYKLGDDKFTYTFTITLKNKIYGTQSLTVPRNFGQVTVLEGGVLQQGTNLTVTKTMSTDHIVTFPNLVSLGLTSPCDILDIIKTLRVWGRTFINSSFITILGNRGNNIINLPSSFGLLIINLNHNDGFWVKYTSVMNFNFVEEYTGMLTMTSTDVESITWEKVIREGNATTVIPTATTSSNGLMSSAQVTQLNSAMTSYPNVVQCTTENTTAAKVITIPNLTVVTGTRITVNFINGNNILSPTLNVNSTGAKEIVCRDLNIKKLTTLYGSSLAGAARWDKNTILDLFFNGTQWEVIGNPQVYESNNYRKMYINGYKRIGMTVTTSSNVTLPFVFSTTSYLVTALVKDTTVGNCPVTLHVSNRTITGFHVDGGYANDSGAHDYNGQFNVVVEGF